MASNTETIRSFLVSLGFKVDDEQQRKFATSIAIQTEAVRAFADTLKSVVERVATFVVNTASGMEKLYYASRRTGESASALGALGYAAEQIGISADKALGSFTQFTEFLRNPNSTSYLLQTVHAQFKEGATEIEKYIATLKGLSQLPTYQQEPVATMVGIPVDVLRLYQTQVKEFESAAEQYSEILKKINLNQDDADASAHNFMSSTRELSLVFALLSQQAGSQILGVLLPYFQKLATYVIAHSDEMSKALKNFIEDFKPLAIVVVDFAKECITSVQDVLHWWNNLGETGKTIARIIIEIAAAVTGLITFLTALAAVLKVVGIALALLDAPVTLVVTGIVAVGLAAYELYKNFTEVKRVVVGLAGVFMNTLKPVLADVGAILGDIFTGNWGDLSDRVKDVSGQLLNGFHDANKVLYPDLWKQYVAMNEADSESGTKQPNSEPEPYSGSSLHSGLIKIKPLGIRSNNPGNLQPGGVESRYGSAQEGLNALVSNLQAYGRKGVDTIRAIISRWAPERDVNGKHINDTEAYIRDVANRLHLNANQHLNLNDPQVLASLARAITIHENGKNPYSQDMFNRAAERGYPVMPPISQSNTITITGVNNPHEVAGAVGSAMKQSNQQLARTFQPRTS